jgi:putative toxin-antitoxin system antitoxin component (TIGR02293 family)
MATSSYNRSEKTSQGHVALVEEEALLVPEFIPGKFDTFSILKVLQAGLSWSRVSRFRSESGFSAQQVAEFLGLPERTFARRRSSGAFLRDESERMLRLMEIHAAALQLFGGDANATRDWLTAPVRGLNHARPIDFAQSDYGAREVRNLIGRLEHGVFS